MESVSTAIRVLLIDSPKGREYWAQRLKRSSPDYLILEADTGAAGISICQSQRVDCVVTELALPDMSGFKVLVSLVPRICHSAIPVIILTHNTLSTMAGLAFKNGARDYLVKSRVSGDDLDRAIHHAIAIVRPDKERHPFSPPQPSTGSTVLVIDDDEGDLKDWSDKVRKLPGNLTVLTAHDCKSGVEMCRDRKIDCVLLDLDMPESGFEALLELIPDRKHPQIAVIVLTHLPNPVLGELAKNNGAMGFLYKQRTSCKDLATAIEQATSFIQLPSPI